MNSEELEQSLRTEFESYLKNILADMRQEVSEFQNKFEAEFEKHKSQIDDIFQGFSARAAAAKEIDASFTDSVVEHLRLARDEGARITAMAIAEAEEMEKGKKAAAGHSPGVSEIRDAINDISSKTTQSAILKTLVNQAAQFTRRGAFFIIKNEHLVGWRVFGNNEKIDDKTVREIFFPVSANTILGKAVKSLESVESASGMFPEDSIYLDKLKFGQPGQMYAIPLVVRKRAVAVLYSDNNAETEQVNIEALETLVRVASMTVEISASRASKTQIESTAYAEEQADYTQEPAELPAKVEESVEQPVFVAAESYAEVKEVYSDSENDAYVSTYGQPVEVVAEPDYPKFIESDNFAVSSGFNVESPELVSVAAEEQVLVAEEASVRLEESFQPSSYQEEQTFEPVPAWSQSAATEDYYSPKTSTSFETPSFESSSFQSFEPVAEPPVPESSFVAEPAAVEYELDSRESFESPPEFEPSQEIEVEEVEEVAETSPTFETPSFESPQFKTENFPAANGQSYGSEEMANDNAESFKSEPVETVSAPILAQPVKSRFSDRNLDLPIDVSEDERRLHNDARRFARLLVSEIKLYNEQKVKDGREENDLYDRLREAIDRSREMYDKRVQPPVAAKFDYFHYELVSNLAEGDEAKLGASYAKVTV